MEKGRKQFFIHSYLGNEEPSVSCSEHVNISNRFGNGQSHFIRSQYDESTDCWFLHSTKLFHQGNFIRWFQGNEFRSIWYQVFQRFNRRCCDWIFDTISVERFEEENFELEHFCGEGEKLNFCFKSNASSLVQNYSLNRLQSFLPSDLTFFSTFSSFCYK